MARQTAKPKEPVRLREKELANGNKSLYLDIYRDGKRSYEFLKLYLVKGNDPITKEQNKQTMLTAQAIRSKRQIEIQNGEYEFTKQYKTDTPVLEYFRKMCEERHGNTESRGNWGNWYSCLKHLEGYCSEDTTFKEVDQDWIEGFKDYLNNVDKDTYKLRDGKINSRGRVSKPLSQNSKVSYFAKLRACMNKAYDDKIIPTNPIRNVENFKAEDVERVYLTLDEVRSLAQAECDYPILKRAFLFSCLTGIRKSDIERLTWGQVTKFGDFTRITFTQKKTTKLLYLDITEEAVSYMGERGGFNDLVFDGFKYSSQTLVELKRWCLKAGITKDVTFHSGRHTFAVLMITLGADIYTVQKLLGHSYIQTTQIYAKVIDQKRQQAVSMIPKINIEESSEDQ